MEDEGVRKKGCDIKKKKQKMMENHWLKGQAWGSSCLTGKCLITAL